MTVCTPIRLGLVGIGKIARDQHLPAIGASDRFTIGATACHHSSLDGVPGYRDIADMIAGGHDLDAVSLCTPPGSRFGLAAAAIDAGLHVMLEKPPAATVSQALALADRARARGVVLFDWKEDIRRWHPGQDWILDVGGFGVFDPGINALSIATDILPDRLMLDTATMEVPQGRASPLRAELQMTSGRAPVAATFDFLQTGPQTWDIAVDTDAGTMVLSMGGRILTLPGSPPEESDDREYARLYMRFAEAIAAGESDVDIRPLQIVADAFLVAERRAGPRFDF
jgi:L-arabinose 1- dehydrogenase